MMGPLFGRVGEAVIFVKLEFAIVKLLQHIILQVLAHTQSPITAIIKSQTGPVESLMSFCCCPHPLLLEPFVYS